MIGNAAGAAGVYLALGGRESQIMVFAGAAVTAITSETALAHTNSLIWQERGLEIGSHSPLNPGCAPVMTPSLAISST